MNLDHDACYSAIRVRDARYDGRFFTAVKTTRIYCRPVCPARTPCRAMSSSTPRPRPRRRPASIPACAAARKSRPPPAPRRAARQRGARVAADRAGCAGRGRSGRAGRPDRRRRAPAAAAVPRAPGRLSRRRRPDPPRAAGQATDPRDAPAHGRDRVRLGLWQHPPLQRALPAAVRPPARRPAPFLAAGRTGRTRGRDPAAAALSPTLRLGRDAGLPAAARHRRHRTGAGTPLHAQHQPGRRAGHGGGGTRQGRRAAGHRALSPAAIPARDHRPPAAAIRPGQRSGRHRGAAVA